MMRRVRAEGFTLVEIMVVVVIIGLLAAMAVPAFQRVQDRSRMTRFVNDARVFSEALQTAVMETGRINFDSGTGNLHPDLAPYIQSAKFLQVSPIGGRWDVEYNKSGVTLAVGVHGFTVSNDFLLRLDGALDDGNLATGKLRRIASDRYYLVVID